MGFKSFAAAAVGVAVLSAAAPASALELTFFIDVQSSSAGAPAVADFYETWTFTPVQSESGFNVRYRGPISGLMTTPQTADLLDLVGLTGVAPDAFSEAGASTNTFIGATSLAFRQGISVYDGSEAQEYRHELSLQSPSLGQIMSSADDAGLIDFIMTYGGYYIGGAATGAGLNWLEGAEHRDGFFMDPSATIFASRRYDGKAYLSAVNGVAVTLPGGPGAVPEPGTWALMILGFGAAGAMLRRRNLAAA